MSLKGKKIAILATDGFEQSELFEPKEALEKAGAEVEVVSINKGEIKGWRKGDWGRICAVDKVLDDATPEDYDGLMIPGGVMNPDKLRNEVKAVQFVQGFVDTQKPIAAICHGPQVLIETGYVTGKTMTSWPSLKTDLINAGANWVDREVVVDHGLITSRKPEDIPAFNKKMIEEFIDGIHGSRQTKRRLDHSERQLH